MYFSDLQGRLLEYLRERVRNGDLTERSLARCVGVSQPHIHNVLKGIRVLSPEIADRILRGLGISLNDLLGLPRFIHMSVPPPAKIVFIPMLSGVIGPGHPWPTRLAGEETAAVPANCVVGTENPVAARLAYDPEIGSGFDVNELVLFDQALQARREIREDAYYLVKREADGIVRRLRKGMEYLYLISERIAGRPSEWERISLAATDIRHVVRARVVLLGAKNNRLPD